MKKLLLLLAFISHSMLAQPYSLDWVTTLQESIFLYVSDITTDKDGNIFKHGSYYGNADLDPSQGRALLHQPQDTNLEAVFISKTDPLGNLKWALGIASNRRVISIKSFDTDSEGNLFVAGSGSKTLYLESTTNGNSQIPLNGETNFLLKISSDGQIIWMKQLVGTGTYSAGINSIVVAKNDDIILTGGFGGNVDFDFSNSSFVLSGLGDIYIARTNNDGNFKWAKKYGGAKDLSWADVICESPQGSIFIGGTFQDTLSFTPANTLVANYLTYFDTIHIPLKDLFVAKFDSMGTFGFAHSLNSPSLSFKYIHDITADKFGNINVVGSFTDTLLLDNSTIISQNPYGTYGYLFQFDPVGNQNWSTILNGQGTGMAFYQGIDTDTNGNIYTGGRISGAVDLDPGASVVNSTTQGIDFFIQKLDNSGNYLWSHIFGGISSDFFNGLTVDNQQILVAGAFSDSVDFDPSPLVYKEFHYGSCDKATFTLKLKNCSQSAFYQKKYGCDEVLLNSKSYTSNGFIVDTITSNGFCDSIVRTEIILSDIDTTIVMLNDGTLMSNEFDGDSYQWVDCENHSQIIPGETSIGFKPSKNGLYAVKITKDSCETYSSCFSYHQVSQKEIDVNTLKLYPNPARDFISVLCNHSGQPPFSVSIHSMAGQVVLEVETIDSTEFRLDVSNLPLGIYTLKIIDKHNSYSQIFVKQ